MIHVAAEQAPAAVDALAHSGKPVLGPVTRRGTVPVSIDVADQAATDRCVDQLRAASVSIWHLEVRRPSLEDIFLEIVRTA